MHTARRVERWKPRAGLLLALMALAIAGLLQTGPVRAATLIEFDVWMHDIEHRLVALQKGLEAGDLSGADAEARRLRELYAKMQTWFEQQGSAASGAQMSEAAVRQSEQLLQALAQQDAAKARGYAKALGQGCGECHDLYKPFQ